MESIDIESIAACAREAMLKGSEVLNRYFGLDAESLGAVRKQDNSVQTKADKESEEVVVGVLQRDFPECSIYAEEGGEDRRGDARFQILVDPLDGTSNYYRGREGFGVCVALVDYEQDRQVVFVSSYEPASRRLWTAARGQGCVLEVVDSGRAAVRARVSDRAPEGGDICFDASTSPRNVFDSVECKAMIVQKAIPLYKRFRMLGSNVLAHALVAGGNFEAAVTDAVGGPFDIAGHLLVEEAGGRATNLHGQPVNVFDDQIVITSNGKGHDDLLAALQQAYQRPNLASE